MDASISAAAGLITGIASFLVFRWFKRSRRPAPARNPRPVHYGFTPAPGKRNDVWAFAVLAGYLALLLGQHRTNAHGWRVVFAAAPILALVLSTNTKRRPLRVGAYLVAFGSCMMSYLTNSPVSTGDVAWLFIGIHVTDTIDLYAGKVPPAPRETLRRDGPIAVATVAIVALVLAVGPRGRTLFWSHRATLGNVLIDIALAAGMWTLAIGSHFIFDRAVRAAARAQAAVTAERARIARELHDVVAHDLSVVVIQAQAGQAALPGDPAQARDDLVSIERAGRDALTELRRLIGALRDDKTDDALAPQPDLRNLDELVAQMNEAGLRVQLRVDCDLGRVPAGASVSAFRIVQEALTNTRKHAGPVPVAVTVTCDAGAVHVTVTDEGRLAPAAVLGGGGHGIVGMHERVALFGGTVDAGPRPAGGWHVEAHLPFGTDGG